MKYYLGLDNGGTTTKASLYTEDGREVSTKSTETAMLTPRPGYTERDMDEMWQANCYVIKKVLEQSHVMPQDVAAVAVCGHGKGLYLWDKADKPAYPGIISTDNRAWEVAQRWKEDGTEGRAFALSCQHVMACQPVALLKWLMENEPYVIDNVQWIFSCKDYIRFRLTDCARAERTDFSGANLINLHTAEYDDRLLDIFGLSQIRNALPLLCNATDLSGTISHQAAVATGLLAGTPVAGGMFDIDACALAALTTDEDHICMIAGTWSINEYIRKTPVMDGSVMMNSLYCLPGYYLVEESSATSAGNYAWFLQTLLPEFAEECRNQNKRLFDIVDGWVEDIPPKEFCPVFLPFLMASNVHPNAMGSFVGISNYHTRAHLLRAVYEGIAFSHRFHYERLLRSKSKKPISIRLTGGAARSPVWAQMFADVMQMPIETVSARETGTLGCAIAAAVACGAYTDGASAAEAMTHLSVPIQPNEKNSVIYNAKYAIYLDVIQALDGVWSRMQKMI